MANDVTIFTALVVFLVLTFGGTCWIFFGDVNGIIGKAMKSSMARHGQFVDIICRELIYQLPPLFVRYETRNERNMI